MCVYAEVLCIWGKRCHLYFITSFYLLRGKYGFFFLYVFIIYFYTRVYNSRYWLVWKCLKYLPIIVHTFLLILFSSQIIHFIVLKFLMLTFVIAGLFLLPINLSVKWDLSQCSPILDKGLSEEENVFCNLEIVQMFCIYNLSLIAHHRFKHYMFYLAQIL